MADIQKEMKIRRRVESIFNRSREDFATLQEYGDYEEQREDTIYNLSEGVDVDAMEARIAAYQREHYDEILRNEARKVESRRQRLEDTAPRQEPGPPAAEAPAPPQPAAAAAAGPSFQPPPPQASLPPAPTLVAGDERVRGGNLGAAGEAGDREQMGLASGWHPDMPRRRALEEAFSSIFVS